MIHFVMKIQLCETVMASQVLLLVAPMAVPTRDPTFFVGVSPHSDIFWRSSKKAFLTLWAFLLMCHVNCRNKNKCLD